jgi:RimJ/RimL family protein N-acetyltransferase
VPDVDARPSDGVPDDAPFAGDPTWCVSRTLRDGTSITIRPVVESDREELHRAFVALSPESRYLRFLHGGVEPTEEMLTYLTNVDQQDHVALAATMTSSDLKSERGIGIARFIRLEDAPDTAEAAVTVVDDMHRRGVGTALLRELLRAAHARGIRSIRANVLADNTTIRSILDRARASVVPNSECGDGTLSYDLPIPETDATSRNEPSSPTFFDVLRSAAETMAVRFRR